MQARRGNTVSITAVSIAAGALAWIGFIGDTAAQPRMNAGLTQLMRSLKLRVATGRITVAGPMSFQTHKSEFKTTSRHERLELTQAGPSTTFHYELITPNTQLTWELLAQNEVMLRRLPRSDPLRSDPQGGDGAKFLVFSQPTEGPLLLAVGVGDERKELRAKTLWHLFLAEPELCRDELLPLLQIVKPGWNLGQLAEKYETLLCRSADVRGLPMRAVWLGLVGDLGHEKFSRRQAADRRLRLIDADALPFLISLDQKQLDAEQRWRVRSIMRSLTSREDREAAPDDDAPDRIVRMLIDDPDVWFGILDREDVEKQRIAVAQLSRLFSEDVAFNPAAQAAQRREQIRTLRRRLQP